MIRNVLYLIYGLIILMLVRMVMQWIGRTFGPKGPRKATRGSKRTGPKQVEDLVRDPVCRTYVPRSKALPETVDGRQEFFCSEACRDRARSVVPSAS